MSILQQRADRSFGAGVVKLLRTLQQKVDLTEYSSSPSHGEPEAWFVHALRAITLMSTLARSPEGGARIKAAYALCAGPCSLARKCSWGVVAISPSLTQATGRPIARLV